MEASQIIDIIKTGGWALSPFLFWLWLRSDTERREVQERLDTLSVDTVKVVTAMQITLLSVKDSIFAGRAHLTPPSSVQS